MQRFNTLSSVYLPLERYLACKNSCVMSSLALFELSNAGENNPDNVISVISDCICRLLNLHYQLAVWSFEKHAIVVREGLMEETLHYGRWRIQCICFINLSVRKEFTGLSWKF